MEIYAWCIMPSHVHLAFRSTVQKPDDLIRDFKSFTSKNLIILIKNNIQESRRDWLLALFEKAGGKNSNNKKYQFWQQHNQPIQLWSAPVIDQKINYIHDNPVEAGFVDNGYEYLYSSARDYNDIKGLVKIFI